MRKMLKRFYERDRIGIIEGKLESVKYDKGCLIDVKIFNCHRPEKVIAGFPHLWVKKEYLNEHYDHASAIVKFYFKSYMYIRDNGTEDYSVMAVSENLELLNLFNS